MVAKALMTVLPKIPRVALCFPGLVLSFGIVMDYVIISNYLLSSLMLSLAM